MISRVFSLFLIFSYYFKSICFASDLVYKEDIFQIKINNVPAVYSLVCLQSENKKVFISEEDWLQQLKLEKADIEGVKYNNQLYYDLSQLDGVDYHLDEVNLVINLDVEALWFSKETINVREKKENLYQTYASTGAFLNYDLDIFSAADQYGYNFSNKLVFFSPYGNFENNYNYVSISKKEDRFLRLDSTIIYKNPDKLMTFRLGDMVSEDVGVSGGGIRLAGVQIQKDYSLAPEFNTMSLPNIDISSKLPSTLDLFVNNNKQFSKEIDAGVLTLQDIPVTSGVGLIKAVLKDGFGGVQEFYVPYYASIDLLKKGLYEYSIDAGFERKNYALDSDNYGDFMSVISYKQGLSKYITGEGQWYYANSQHILRYGGVFALGYLGSLRAWVANSWNGDNQKNAYGMMIRTQYKQFFSNVSWQKMDADINSSNIPLDITSRLGLSLSLSLKDKGAFDAMYTVTQNNMAEQKYFRIGYNYSLNRYGFINVSANYNQEKKDVVAQILFSMNLMENDRLSIGLGGNGYGNINFNKRYNKNFGYSISVLNNNEFRNYNANLMLANNYGDYQFRFKYDEDSYASSLGMQGAFIFLNNSFFASKNISNSFSVVDLNKYKDVRVYANNQFVGKTNKKGIIVVNDLQEYQSNKLKIEAIDLPLNAKIILPERMIKPSYNSGIYLKYDIQKQISATLTVVLDDGKEAPMGMQVFDTHGNAFMVGYNGEVYLDNLIGNDVLKIVWKGQQCQIKIEPVADDQIVPHLGAYICHGVMR